MTDERHMLRRMAMALAIAYLVVLQAFLGGMASGAYAAAGAGYDSFAQVICRGLHGTSSAPAAPADPSHHLPDCCSTGCLMSVGTPLPPAAGFVPAERPAVVVAAVLPPATLAPVIGAERSPRNTRAPPLA
ncbi:hypothetical protein [Ancylobacter mangrovi]|uniref:hypothetical protein n=1 Tax=Ancylobacter mangrovi TaxID=2972472 RepID=UPI0021638176|nr:hypothetical protein [Ancylobacter mangrovi]MCS0501325.1 hypothetical protein [Ancylobacter mangrovi]